HRARHCGPVQLPGLVGEGGTDRRRHHAHDCNHDGGEDKEEGWLWHPCRPHVEFTRIVFLVWARRGGKVDWRRILHVRTWATHGRYAHSQTRGSRRAIAERLGLLAAASGMRRGRLLELCQI